MARSPRLQAAAATLDEAALLAFLAPGMAHQLGNALLAVQGNAAQIGSDRGDPKRWRESILRGGEQMQNVLDALRFLLPADLQMPPPPMQAGVLLSRVGHLLRVPLRERGVRFALVHSSTQTPVEVDGRLLLRAVLVAARGLVEVLPAGYEGTLELDLRQQDNRGVELQLALIGLPSRLPFPVAVGDVVAASAPALRRLGVVMRQLGGGRPGLLLVVPAARGRADASAMA